MVNLRSKNIIPKENPSEISYPEPRVNEKVFQITPLEGEKLKKFENDLREKFNVASKRGMSFINQIHFVCAREWANATPKDGITFAQRLELSEVVDEWVTLGCDRERRVALGMRLTEAQANTAVFPFKPGKQGEDQPKKKNVDQANSKPITPASSVSSKSKRTGPSSVQFRNSSRKSGGSIRTTSLADLNSFHMDELFKLNELLISGEIDNITYTQRRDLLIQTFRMLRDEFREQEVTEKVENKVLI